MVVGLNGHPGVVVLRRVVWAHVPAHELAQILLQKEAELTVLAPITEQRAATNLYVQVRQKSMYSNVIVGFDLKIYDFEKLCTARHTLK